MLFRKCPGLDVQSYRQALGKNSPLSQQVSEESYLNVGVSKYFVSKGVFSTRTAHFLSLADSMLVKAILDVSREFAEKNTWAPALVGGNAVPQEEISPAREVRRVVLPVRIPSGPVIRLPPVDQGEPKGS